MKWECPGHNLLSNKVKRRRCQIVIGYSLFCLHQKSHLYSQRHELKMPNNGFWKKKKFLSKRGLFFPYLEIPNTAKVNLIKF